MPRFSPVVLILDSSRANWASLAKLIKDELEMRSIQCVLISLRSNAIRRIYIAVVYYFLTKILRRKVFVLTSDFDNHIPSSRVSCIRFLWNTADEIAHRDAKCKPVADYFISRECFSPPFSSFSLSLLNKAGATLSYTYAPTLICKLTPAPERTRRVFFASEVYTKIPESILPSQISNSEYELFDNILWERAHDSLRNHSLNRSLPSSISLDHPLAGNLQWVLLNRIRYLYIVNLKSQLGSRLIVRGDDWIRIGLPQALPSSYKIRDIGAAYLTHRLSLDLGGKSCHSSLYPRLADIFVAGGMPVQAVMPNSPTFNWPQFNSLDQSLALIENILGMSDADYNNLNELSMSEYEAISKKSMQNLALSILGQMD